MIEAASRLRVVTWNVHRCIGRDGKRNVARVSACIRALAPDIAAFQEVDTLSGSSGEDDTYRHLCAQVGDHGHDAWTVSGADGNYGQVLASRYHLSDKRVHDISVPGYEPRRVMEAHVALPGASIRVIATHLGLRRRERQRQVERLRDIVTGDLSSPVLLLGDFNEWFRPHVAQRTLFDPFDHWTAHASFPSRLPVLPLDRIMCGAGTALLSSRAVREAAHASDHLPVVAEISVPAT